MSNLAKKVNGGSGAGGEVSSVFGRIGNVVAENGDYIASQITNTPSGNISSVDVQSAIDELDSNKLSVINGEASTDYFIAKNSVKYCGSISSVDGKTQISAATPDYMNFNLLGVNPNVTISAPEGENMLHGITFDISGKYMYVSGRTADKIYQYELSTNFLISTAVLIDEADFIELTGDRAIAGIGWSCDGSKCYVAGDETNRIYQFSASTNFSVSTLTYETSQFFAEGGSNLSDFEMSPDGTKIIVQFDVQDIVNEYDLLVPFMIDSATFVRSVDLSGYGILRPVSTMITPTGDTLCLYDNEYKVVTLLYLNSPWSLESIRLNGSFSVPDRAFGLAYSIDGSYFYSCDLSTIRQYYLSIKPNSISMQTIGPTGESSVTFYNSTQSVIGSIAAKEGTPSKIFIESSAIESSEGFVCPNLTQAEIDLLNNDRRIVYNSDVSSFQANVGGQYVDFANLLLPFYRETSGQVIIDSYDQTTPTKPTFSLTTTATNSPTPWQDIVWDSTNGFNFAAAPITQFPIMDPNKDESSIWDETNQLLRENNSAGQNHLWRINLELTRTAAFSVEFVIRLYNPATGFSTEESVYMSNKNSGLPETKKRTIQLSTVATADSLSVGRGYKLQVRMYGDNDATLNVEVDSLARFSLANSNTDIII